MKKINIFKILKKLIGNIFRLPAIIDFKFKRLVKYIHYLIKEKPILIRYKRLIKQNKDISGKDIGSVASIYAAREKYTEAINAIEKYLDNVPKEKNDGEYISLYGILAFCHYENKNNKKTVEIINNILNKENVSNNKKVAYYLILADIYRDNYDFKNAYNNLFQAIPILTEKFLYFFFINLIKLLEDEGKNLLAQKAKAIRPKLKQKKLNYKTLKFLAKEISEIAEISGSFELHGIERLLYENMLKCKEFEPSKEFCHSASIAYFQIRDLKNAKKYITYGLYFKPNIEKDWHYYLVMALILANSNKYKSAIVIMERLLIQDNIKNDIYNKNEIYYDLVWCYTGIKQYEKAIEYVGKINEKVLNNDRQSYLKEMKEEINKNLKQI